MDWETIFETSDIKILFYLYDKQVARYNELEKLIRTRSVVSVSLQDLTSRKLIDRMVEPSKPIQTRYKLTEKGERLVQLLIQAQKLVL